MIKKQIDIHTDLSLNNRALVIGFFDGIHLGHKALIDECLSSNYIPAVLTFSFDMKAKLSGKSASLLLTEEEKENTLSSLGIKEYYVLSFNEELKNTTIDDFLSFLRKLSPKMIIVGNDFTFAKNGLGTYKDLLKLNDTIDIKVLDLRLFNEEKISSSRIKMLLNNKELKLANNLLGYNFYYENEVIKGLNNGSKLGYRTANILPPENKLLLPLGVYKTKTIIDGIEYKSMTNIGTHPTIEEVDKIIIETHIFDFNQSLYGKKIKVEFLDFIRDQYKFDSVDKLINQLKIDEEKCK